MKTILLIAKYLATKEDAKEIETRHITEALYSVGINETGLMYDKHNNFSILFCITL